MAWIMTGHIFCYAYATTDNMQTTFAKAQSWVFQPILSAPTSVDTFFVLGFVAFISCETNFLKNS